MKNLINSKKVTYIRAYERLFYFKNSSSLHPWSWTLGFVPELKTGVNVSIET